MDVKNKTQDQHATASATNAAATATLAAPGVGKQYYIVGFSASFGAAAPPAIPVAVTITIGAFSKTYYISTQPLWVELDYPIPSGSNGAASISLGAGGAAVIGAVNMGGFIGPSTLND